MQNIIKVKRDNEEELSKEQIQFWVQGFINDQIPDYQISALLMAICINGMTDIEMSNLTEVMLKSGKILDLSDIKGFKVDKHSTGGVGDKVSIPLVAIVSSCGGIIPMISGRCLGHTGGTIDKLESIPGFQTNLSIEKFIQNLKNVNCQIISQTEDIAPADKKIYDLRGVSGTVQSIPLIASSIMSKKLASGLNGLVLDVKYGSGAFMKTKETAEQLAQAMIAIGKQMGKEMKAFITNMDQPLGFAIGNSIEIIESVELLKGNGPQDLQNLTFSLAIEMLVMSKIAKNTDEAKDMVIDSIKTEKALKQFKKFIESQGGDSSFIEDYSLLPSSKMVYDINAKNSGFINQIDTTQLGWIAAKIHAGKLSKTDVIDHSAGIYFYKKIGDEIKEGEKIGELHINDQTIDQQQLIQEILSTFKLKQNKDEVKMEKLIWKII